MDGVSVGRGMKEEGSVVKALSRYGDSSRHAYWRNRFIFIFLARRWGDVSKFVDWILGSSSEGVVVTIGANLSVDVDYFTLSTVTFDSISPMEDCSKYVLGGIVRRVFCSLDVCQRIR